jgi:hypothetical protein
MQTNVHVAVVGKSPYPADRQPAALAPRTVGPGPLAPQDEQYKSPALSVDRQIWHNTLTPTTGSD